MTIVLDTGVLYAYYDADDRWHEPSRDLLAAEAGGLVVPSPILPELDHLLGRRLGPEAQRTLYQGIVDGHFFVVDLPRDAIAEELLLGRIATTDRRHFTAVAAATPLELLPAAPAP